MTSHWRSSLDFFQVIQGVSIESASDSSLKFAFTDIRGSAWFVSDLPREKRSYRWNGPMRRCDCIA